jgi:hypothetical protein
MAAGAGVGGGAAGRKQRGRKHLDRGAKWGHSFLEAALGIEMDCNHGRPDVGVRPIVRALAVSIREGRELVKRASPLASDLAGSISHWH